MAFFNKLKQVGKGLTLGALDTTARLLPSLMQHKREDRLREEERDFRVEERIARQEESEVQRQATEIRSLFDNGRYDEAINRATEAGLEGLAKELAAAKPGAITAKTHRAGRKLGATATGAGAAFLTRPVETFEQRTGLVSEMGKSISSLRSSTAAIEAEALRAGGALPPGLALARKTIEELESNSESIRAINRVQKSLDIFTFDRARLTEGFEAYRKVYAAATDEETADAATIAYMRSVNTLRGDDFIRNLTAYGDAAQLRTDALRYGLSGKYQMKVEAYARKLDLVKEGKVSARENANFSRAMDLMRIAQEQGSTAAAAGNQKGLDTAKEMLLGAADILESIPNQGSLVATIRKDPVAFMVESITPSDVNKTVAEWADQFVIEPGLVMHKLALYGYPVKGSGEVSVELIRKVVREKVFGFPVDEEEEITRTAEDVVDGLVSRIEVEKEKAKGGNIGDVKRDLLAKIHSNLTEEQREELTEAAFEKGWIISWNLMSVQKVPWTFSEFGEVVDSIGVSMGKAAKVLSEPAAGKQFLQKINRLNLLRSPQVRDALLGEIEKAAGDFLSYPNPPLTEQQKEVIKRQRGGVAIFSRANQ